MADKQALRTLFNTYWSSTGWKQPPDRPDHSSFEHAKRCGVMFDSVSIDHDRAIRCVIESRDALSQRRVVDGFVASLTSRRLDLRSALGSYAVFRNATAHAFSGDNGLCAVCGAARDPVDEDLNPVNFERFKWGGVRHEQPVYAALDLELLARDEAAVVTPADVNVLRAVLAAIENCTPSTSSARLHSVLAGVLRSNKQERDVLVAILGFCGILETSEHKGYRARFMPFSSRELPGRRFVDMPYPACWWSGADGLNWTAVDDFFGHVL